MRGSVTRRGRAWPRRSAPASHGAPHRNALLIARDQPLITTAHLSALRDAWLAGSPIAASRFDGILGAPALFDRTRWDDLDKLEGDRGAASLLRGSEVAAIEWSGGAVDVDTDDDIRVLHATVNA